MWAQLDVGWRSDPRLFGRPDSDFRLWVCLNLFAKEHAPLDGVVRGLAPSDLKAMFGVRATVKSVADALQYFATCAPGPMIRLDADGSIAILGWSESGNSYDPGKVRQEWRERKKRQREREASESRERVKSRRGSRVTVTDGSRVTVTDRVTDRHADVTPLDIDIDIEVEKDKPPVVPQGGQVVLGTGPDSAEQLFAHWKRVMGQPGSVYDDKRRKFLELAVKNYGFSNCTQAIDGCRASPHNMGANEQRQRYDGLKVIFKDRDQVERFVRVSDRPPVTLDHDGLAMPMPRGAGRSGVSAPPLPDSAWDQLDEKGNPKKADQ